SPQATFIPSYLHTFVLSYSPTFPAWQPSRRSRTPSLLCSHQRRRQLAPTDCQQGSVPPGGFAITQRLMVRMGEDGAARCFDDRLRGGGVPFHRGNITQVRIGRTFRDEAEFQGASDTQALAVGKA